MNTLTFDEQVALLLKDLCARLPYKVMVHIRYNTKEPCYGELTPKDIQWFIDSKIKEIKPYLRPMSSMTKEEKKEAKNNGCIIYWDTSLEDKGLIVIASPKGFDWLNAHHFDYRGLIERRLALEAPEGMYNVKDK